MTGVPVRWRCGRCGTLGPVGDVDVQPARCEACGAGASFGDRVALFGHRHWAVSLAIVFVVFVVLALLLT